MNDAYVEDLLVRWGEFVSGKVSGAVGYPKRCVTFRVEPVGTSAALDLVHPDLMRVDSLMAGLKRDRLDLFMVAKLYYVDGMPIQSVAFYCRIGRMTAYRRLDAVRNHILACMND